MSRSLVSNCVWDKRVIMSPGECYLMQLSAKITHSSLSELVIAIYRRTDTMKKMGLGNLNWTPNPPGESFNENALLHTPSEALFSNTCVCQCTIGRTGWIQSKILRSNQMFFSPMIGSALASTAVVCTLTVRLWPLCQAPEKFWFCLSMFAFHCVANYRSGFL